MEKGQITVKVEFRNGRISRQIELNGIRCQKLEQEMQRIEEENLQYKVECFRTCTFACLCSFTSA